VTQPLRQLSRNIDSLLSFASSHVRNVLYVHLAPGIHFINSVPRLPNVVPTSEASKAVLSIYSGSANLCSSLDIHVLLSNLHSTAKPIAQQTLSKPLHVVMCDAEANDHLLSEYVAQNFNATDVEVKYLNLEVGEESDSSEPIKTYSHVCLGGTFDRIHTGHKILLSQALMRCNNIITIGVTDGPMTESE
jgi:phosphopantetheine adenylyltransferase/dephospho-CoA kinase